MTQKQNGKPQSKADFVRSFPKSTSPADIIAKGKEAGITISAANVHATRYQDGANGHKAKGTSKAKRKASTAAAKKVSKPKAVTAAARKRALGKYPNMRKTSEAIEPIDSKELAERVVTGMRQLVRLSVRDEIKEVMGGLFGAQVGNYLSR